MKDSDKSTQGYSGSNNSISSLSPRSQLNLLNNGLQPGGGEMSPEVYAQYMYMYNYMYIQQQQQLAWTNSVYPGDAYRLMGQTAGSTGHGDTGHKVTGNSAKVTGHSAKVTGHSAKVTEVDNTHALKAQQNKAGKLSPKYEQRYQPYARPTAKKVVDTKTVGGYNMNKRSDNLVTSGSEGRNNVNKNEMCKTQDSTDSGSVTRESPLDLSRKTEKLQYLDTLRQLIESSDKRQVSAAVDNSKAQGDRLSHTSVNSTSYTDKTGELCRRQTQVDNEGKTCKTEKTQMSASHDERSQSPNLNKSRADKPATLESKKDKLEFLSVLKELFEKGHSSTSKNILGAEQKDDSSAGVSGVTKTRPAEDSLDDLSVDQSLVLRKRHKIE